MVLTLLCSALALGQAGPDLSALPREMSIGESKAKTAQDPTQERYPPLDAPSPSPHERGFLDLDWLELTSGVGFAAYSAKYRADPGAALSISAHSPIPWLSPASDPVGDYFGLFLEGDFMTIDRKLSPTVDHRRGIASFYTLGLDYSFVRDGTWILVGRTGLLYSYYGGVADLHSGVGFMVGAAAGLQISGRLGLTYSPEILFGDRGSLVFLNTLGVLIQF